MAKNVSEKDNKNNNIKSVIIKNSLVKKVKTRIKYLFKDVVVSAPKNLKQGELVNVLSQDKKRLGCGFINPSDNKSYICFVTWGKTDFNDEYIMNKLNSALLLRTKYILRSKELYRLVDSYNDLLPGLVIDKVRDNAIIHIQNSGWLNYLDVIQLTLVNRLPIENIYINITDEIQKQEKINKRSFSLQGEFNTQNSVVEEKGLKYIVDLMNPNEIQEYIKYKELRNFVADNVIDKDVLILYPNKFSGVHAYIAGGAKSVTVACNRKEVLSSESKVVELNSLDKTKFIEEEDPFKFLNQCNDSKRKFDLVILYNPPFLKKDMNEQELKRYKGLIQRILNVLNFGSFFIDTTPIKFNNINNYKNSVLEAISGRDLQIVQTFGAQKYMPFSLSSSTLMNYETLIYKVN